MRITGTFSDIYAGAKSMATGGDIYGGCPIDPVVRREGGKWMIESALEPRGEDNDFECSLEEFDSYFYEAYKSDFIPDDGCVNEFVAVMIDLSPAE